MHGKCSQGFDLINCLNLINFSHLASFYQDLIFVVSATLGGQVRDSIFSI